MLVSRNEGGGDEEGSVAMMVFESRVCVCVCVCVCECGERERKRGDTFTSPCV